MLQWLFFEQERVMSGIGGARFRIVTNRGPELAKRRQELGRSALEMLEAQLADRDFLLGERGHDRDVANFAYTSRPTRRPAAADYPAVSAWLDRVRALPGFMDDSRALSGQRPRRGQSLDLRLSHAGGGLPIVADRRRQSPTARRLAPARCGVGPRAWEAQQTS